MKFKYALGDRVLHKVEKIDSDSVLPRATEHMGIVTGITYEMKKGGTKTSYELDDSIKVQDSHILGKIQFLKAPVARSHKKKPKVQSDFLEPQLNGQAQAPASA